MEYDGVPLLGNILGKHKHAEIVVFQKSWFTMGRKVDQLLNMMVVDALY
jgi:hypothetical protein